MTLDQFCIKLKSLGISKRQAAKDIGYSKDHFRRVVNRNLPLTRKFLDDLNTYIEMKINQKPLEESVIDIQEDYEMSIWHHNEWQKLKYTEMYKSIMNEKSQFRQVN